MTSMSSWGTWVWLRYCMRPVTIDHQHILVSVSVSVSLGEPAAATEPEPAARLHGTLPAAAYRAAPDPSAPPHLALHSWPFFCGCCHGHPILVLCWWCITGPEGQLSSSPARLRGLRGEKARAA